jgi:hypothetical protein
MRVVVGIFELPIVHSKVNPRPLVNLIFTGFAVFGAVFIFNSLEKVKVINHQQ